MAPPTTQTELSAGPPDATYWDRVAQLEPRDSAPLWRRQSDAANTMLLERWLPAMGPAASVLKTDLFDEAVAPGLYPALRSRAGRVVGVDVSPAMVAAATARHPAMEAVVADVRALPFAGLSIDAVVSNSTLDHFAGPEDVAAGLSELRRVLRPGGRLVLTLDNPLQPLIAVRNALPARAALAVRGVSYGTGWTCGPRRLRGMVEECGLVVEREAAVVHLPRVLLAAVDRRGSERTRERWLARARAAERLGSLPTRYLSGHFLAVLAVRPPGR